jgi:hypothetical protein
MGDKADLTTFSVHTVLYMGALIKKNRTNLTQPPPRPQKSVMEMKISNFGLSFGLSRGIKKDLLTLICPLQGGQCSLP